VEVCLKGVLDDAVDRLRALLFAIGAFGDFDIAIPTFVFALAVHVHIDGVWADEEVFTNVGEHHIYPTQHNLGIFRRRSLPQL